MDKLIVTIDETHAIKIGFTVVKEKGFYEGEPEVYSLYFKGKLLTHIVSWDGEVPLLELLFKWFEEHECEVEVHECEDKNANIIPIAELEYLGENTLVALNTIHEDDYFYNKLCDYEDTLFSIKVDSFNGNKYLKIEVLGEAYLRINSMENIKNRRFFFCPKTTIRLETGFTS